jgi:integrase
MARKSSDKPWLHKASGFWCVTLAGKRSYLDKDYRTACRKLKSLRSQADRERANGHRDWLDAAFSELADEFLSDIKARKKAGTYRNFRYCLLRALKIIGTKVRVGEMRKFHLGQIERELTAQEYSPTTIKDTLATTQGVFQWAVRNDMLDVNPLTGYEKPRARQRTRVFTPAEFQALLRVSDAPFRRFLLALRTTGCRPGEVRTLIWEWVDLEQGV